MAERISSARSEMETRLRSQIEHEMQEEMAECTKREVTYHTFIYSSRNSLEAMRYEMCLFAARLSLSVCPTGERARSEAEAG